MHTMLQIRFNQSSLKPQHDSLTQYPDQCFLYQSTCVLLSRSCRLEDLGVQTISTHFQSLNECLQFYLIKQMTKGLGAKMIPTHTNLCTCTEACKLTIGPLLVGSSAPSWHCIVESEYTNCILLIP